MSVRDAHKGTPTLKEVTIGIITIFISFANPTSNGIRFEVPLLFSLHPRGNKCALKTL